MKNPDYVERPPYPHGFREGLEDLWDSTIEAVGGLTVFLIKVAGLIGAFYIMGFIADKLCGGTNCINL